MPSPIPRARPLLRAAFADAIPGRPMTLSSRRARPSRHPLHATPIPPFGARCLLPRRCCLPRARLALPRTRVGSPAPFHFTRAHCRVAATAKHRSHVARTTT
jgi:hypothetical protein